MSWMELVLGEDYILSLLVAALAGLVNGHALARRLIGNPIQEGDEVTFLIAKIGLVAFFAAIQFLETSSLAQTAVRVIAPIGFYKVIQIILAGVMFWRMSSMKPVISGGMGSDG